MTARREEAFEILEVDGDLDLVWTCEHASEHMPAPWEWPRADRWLVGTHWAYDIGAAELTRELVSELGGVAVLARFTRLLVDPNRPEDSMTLFRQAADGHPVHLNRSLDEDERRARLERLWRPYHEAVDGAVARSRGRIVFALHTFTPVYEGQIRELEVGVLFDTEEELACGLRDALAREGLRVELNQPYSGKEGLIYSADRHARAHGRHALELEVRQDLAVEDVFRRRLVRALADWLRTPAPA